MTARTLPRLGPFASRPAASLLLLLAAGIWIAPQGAGAQELRSVHVSFQEGEGTTLRTEFHRGYAVVSASSLEPLGWRGREGEDGSAVLEHASGLELRFRLGSPYFRWDGTLLQMAHSPYRMGGVVYLPVQLVVDLLPRLLPRAYEFDADEGVLQVAGTPAAAPSPAEPAPASPPEEPEGRAPRLVVIDPGHGGSDPGAVGPGGVREKDIALSLALALARELADRPDLEVRLTRDRDVDVPLWLRGEWATEWRGDRPGVFVSIHANSLPDRPGVRGFETYFLSEARTEHERRVAAAENAPLRRQDGSGEEFLAGDPLLADILRDLRTFDHQHWSSLLADLVQRELGAFHPGSDRGVKQGPFAVITNALMPSVLVEVGFLSNREEERLMSREEFQRDTARAVARAVDAFFRRYPPGGGS